MAQLLGEWILSQKALTVFQGFDIELSEQVGSGSFRNVSIKLIGVEDDSTMELTEDEVIGKLDALFRRLADEHPSLRYRNVTPGE